jgi:hypothetical protein
MVWASLTKSLNYKNFKMAVIDNILYNINDKDTTNIVSLQMNVRFNT